MTYSETMGGPQQQTHRYGSFHHDEEAAPAAPPTASDTSPLLDDGRNGEETDPLLLGKQIVTNAADAIEETVTVGESSTNSASGKPPSAKSRRQRFARQDTSFWEDAVQMKEGTIPQSMVVALCIGTVCGLAATVYYKVLFFLLDFLWKILPNRFVVDVWPEGAYWLWIPLCGVVMAVSTGLSVKYLGEPGDLAYTVQCVHDKAYVAMDHVIPMVAASQFSILGGGSLGPEAPLVAICAALGGFISRTIFKQKSRNVIRKHTLMGMAAALAAFFGCPLGGSLFALEVNSRFGIEYFEHTVEAIFCGEVCVAVFRAATGLTIAPIWTYEAENGHPMSESTPLLVCIGAAIGLLGAGIAALFASFHHVVIDFFKRYDLLDNQRAVKRALLGASVLLTIGVLVPHTLFWGEYEFDTIWNMSPASTLAHVFPTSGLLGFEMDSFWTALVVGFTKMIAVSFTVAGGYRGGFIFPFFAAGAAFGRAFVFLFPGVPVPVACLCFAAGINVAITRTSLATSIILAFLSGEQNSISPVLAASLVSLFATSYMPFIKSQISRQDIEHSLWYEDVDKENDTEGGEAASGEEPS